MSYLNNQENHARQLLGLALAAAMLPSLFVVTGYSGIRSRPSSIRRTNGSTMIAICPISFSLSLSYAIDKLSLSDIVAMRREPRLDPENPHWNLPLGEYRPFFRETLNNCGLKPRRTAIATNLSLGQTAT